MLLEEPGRTRKNPGSAGTTSPRTHRLVRDLKCLESLLKKREFGKNGRSDSFRFDDALHKTASHPSATPFLRRT